ncbi:MAG: hypothetical protein EHM58_15825 [Ignavibacteriae bacterium]|nr:MAG: hypothetical protein EHM58_15825 [Ignavibacteriota bacterium]
MKFSCSIDRQTILRTALILFIFALICFYFIFRFSIDSLNKTDEFFNYLSIIYCVLYVVIVLLFKPTSYVIKDDSLIINRTISKLKVSLLNIEDVFYIAEKDSRLVLSNKFSTLGLFFWGGTFVLGEFGLVKMYATQKRNFILFKTPTGKIVISPDDINGMITCLKKYFEYTKPEMVN